LNTALCFNFQRKKGKAMSALSAIKTPIIKSAKRIHE
jgi:hypothetical protein